MHCKICPIAELSPTTRQLDNGSFAPAFVGCRLRLVVDLTSWVAQHLTRSCKCVLLAQVHHHLLFLSGFKSLDAFFAISSCTVNCPISHSSSAIFCSCSLPASPRSKMLDICSEIPCANGLEHLSSACVLDTDRLLLSLREANLCSKVVYDQRRRKGISC